MKPEIKRMWVDALRSGKYIQGIGQLQPSATKHCCLGVLCEISGLPYDSGEPDPDQDVQEWSGLAQDTRLRYNGKNILIPELNDKHKLSFDEIADLIEEQL